MKDLRKFINTSIRQYLNESRVIDIMKNVESAPNLGNKFGQDVEPKGTYVLKGHTDFNGWINGKAQLKNPLYIEVNDDTLIEYKRELSKKYKAKGSKLSDKIMQDGYDSIITVYPDGKYGEIILLPNARFILDKPSI